MESLANLYEIRAINGCSSFSYTIYEKTSEGNIGKYISINTANKVLANLVNGAAFEGWTPSFFNTIYEKKSNG